MSARWLLPALAIALTSSTAVADGDGAAARALFEQGLALAGEGQHERACPLFQQAVDLEPRAVGGRLHLAQCYEAIGKLASAWAQYRAGAEAAAAAGQAERETFAKERIAALEPQLGRLGVSVAAPLADMRVERDGTEVVESAWGTPIFVDAGEHEIRASAPGHASFATTVTVRDGEEKTVVVPELTPDVAARDPLWPWIVGGLGVACAGLAVGFGIDQAVAQSEVDDHCDAVRCDRSDGFDPASTNARLERDFALWIGFSAGAAAALGAAAVGLAVADDEPNVTAWILRDSGGVMLRGAW